MGKREPFSLGGGGGKRPCPSLQVYEKKIFKVSSEHRGGEGRPFLLHIGKKK